MAEILNITPSAVYRASSNSKTAWDSDDFRTGYAGGNQWRGRIDIPVGAFSGVSTKLVVKVTVDGASKPGTTMGYLSATPLTPNLVMSDSKVGSYQNGPRADLLAASIAESYTYTDEAGTTRMGDSSSVSSGQTFYFVFNTSALKANTTYYVYGLRNSTNSDSGATGFTRAQLSGISATMSYNASYTVTERHYLKDAEGELTQFEDTIHKTVDIGGSYTPSLKTPPNGNTNKGATFAAYSTDWNRVAGGIPGVDYITVNQNLIVEVYYPYAAPGSYVLFKHDGELVECELLRIVNGVPVLLDLFHKTNGEIIEI